MIIKDDADYVAAQGPVSQVCWLCDAEFYEGDAVHLGYTHYICPECAERMEARRSERLRECFVSIVCAGASAQPILGAIDSIFNPKTDLRTSPGLK